MATTLPAGTTEAIKPVLVLTQSTVDVHYTRKPGETHNLTNKTSFPIDPWEMPEGYELSEHANAFPVRQLGKTHSVYLVGNPSLTDTFHVRCTVVDGDSHVTTIDLPKDGNSLVNVRHLGQEVVNENSVAIKEKVMYGASEHFELEQLECAIVALDPLKENVKIELFGDDIDKSIFQLTLLKEDGEGNL